MQEREDIFYAPSTEDRMSTALANRPQRPLANQGLDPAAIEKALISGDLSKLNIDQRLSYYKQVCESVGLNPLTRPFDYIQLNGKLQLYALKAAADQLRKIYGVSVYKLEKQKMDDLYVVTAYARDKDGREDSSTGAVVLGNLKGEMLANALMKAETKAKRRVTLSICGLGLLDETEVASIPGATKTTPPDGKTEQESIAEYEQQFIKQLEKAEAPVTETIEDFKPKRTSELVAVRPLAGKTWLQFKDCTVLVDTPRLLQELIDNKATTGSVITYEYEHVRDEDSEYLRITKLVDLAVEPYQKQLRETAKMVAGKKKNENVTTEAEEGPLPF